ncbi:MAG: ABC transporter permease, partial [Pseudomonadota bacterium]|nr:ABC transporter permease [Pseudomonadota bacterium]
MFSYLVQRVLLMIPTLIAISIITFVIIQLPPGDYLSTYIAELQSQGENVDTEKIEALRAQYGLDRPIIEQYSLWVVGMLQGDFGFSFEYQLPVSEVVGDRLFLTLVLNFATIIFIWIIAIPIGIYSATQQYSWGDYGLTFVGF